MRDAYELAICRRSRDDPDKPGCAANMSEGEVERIIKESQRRHPDVSIRRCGCLGLCPEEGFTVKIDTMPIVVGSQEELYSLLDNYKRERREESLYEKGTP